jgi:uncharacterized tellurite resistance protein B-like protein
MLERLRTWFGARDSARVDRAASLQRAVCVLLVAAARADGEFAADEARQIALTISRHFGLDAEETAELVTLAAAAGERDLFPATRLLNEHLDRAARREVLVMMWRIVFSDGRLEPHEEALMRRAAKLLDIPQRDAVALKLTARQDPAAG